MSKVKWRRSYKREKSSLAEVSPSVQPLLRASDNAMPFRRLGNSACHCFSPSLLLAQHESFTPPIREYLTLSFPFKSSCTCHEFLLSNLMLYDKHLFGAQLLLGQLHSIIPADGWALPGATSALSRRCCGDGYQLHGLPAIALPSEKNLVACHRAQGAGPCLATGP